VRFVLRPIGLFRLESFENNKTGKTPCIIQTNYVINHRDKGLDSSEAIRFSQGKYSTSENSLLNPSIIFYFPFYLEF
jgi:hypothetical protein